MIACYFVILQLIFMTKSYFVGLTCGLFMRNSIEIPCPDSAAGLYVQTRNGQIDKVTWGFVVLGINTILSHLV